MPEGLLELAEAAEILGVHPSTLRRWADAGKVPHLRTLSGRRRFQRADLDRVQKDLQRGATAPSSGRLDELETRALERMRERTRHLAGEPGGWEKMLNEEERLLFHYSGRQLLDLAIQFIRDGEACDTLLQEGKRIAQDYGKICFRIGMTIPQTVETFLFFRQPILESAQSIAGVEVQVNPKAYANLLRMVDFFDVMLVATIESYQKAASTPEGVRRLAEGDDVREGGFGSR